MAMSIHTSDELVDEIRKAHQELVLSKDILQVID
jgi:hypothetical protein